MRIMRTWSGVERMSTDVISELMHNDLPAAVAPAMSPWGMVARLGFAVATAWRPEILILDEVLSVGDEAFARKCQARMEEFRSSGTTTLLVTHSMGGLDARFGWTQHMPPLVYWGSVLIYLLGQAIFQWARYTNRFFSSMVRIQTDRGQTVCKAGPYRYVRHPGYVGGILMAIGMGVVLGSWWACLPQLLAVALLIWRTSREDQTLQSELPGYAEYTRETRYRLLPGVW